MESPKKYIEDFEINLTDKGQMCVNYRGDDPSIDKCNSLLSKKFPVYHLLEMLLSDIGIKLK